MQKNTLPISWSFALTPDQQSTLATYLQEDSAITVWDEAQIPSIQDMEKDSPCLIWLSSAGLRKLQSLPANQTRHLELLPKALLLDKHYTLQDFEEATDFGIAEIVRHPLSKKRLKSVFSRAHEVHNVHHDIICMTREIMLEREILERKNELLTFLVTFLTNTSESLDVEQILQKAFSSFSTLFSARSMHAAFWHQTEQDSTALSLHISAPVTSNAYKEWSEALVSHVKQYVGDKVTINDVCELVLHEQTPEMAIATPADGTLISLPIMVGAEKFGVILLLTEVKNNFGKDQALALDSALKHLALSINNARRFRIMQLHADYDGLTRIHSRRHFDHKLDEELDRFQRYENPLSAIMLDIDNFKHVNDTYGHQMGDYVLKEVASIINNTIRSTDYCARYGGEEFAILLPHTEQAQAFSLAERLRKKIEKHTFTFGNNTINITSSSGLAYLVPGEAGSAEELIKQADEALYFAKHDGKNCTRDISFLQKKTA